MDLTDIKLSDRHLKIIEKYGGDHAGHALALIAAGQLATPVVKWGWQRAKRKEWYTIVVSGMDDLYPDLHEWVLERIPQEERKAMIASTGEEGLGYQEPSDGDSKAPYPSVRLRYDGSRVQDVMLDGHKVWVEVTQEEHKGGRDKIPEDYRRLVEKIKFTANTVEGRDAILGMMDGLQRKKYEKNEPPPLLVPARWGGSWNKRSDLPPRTLDSVILKEGQSERLVADLERFLGSEDWYARTSQPWHRGILLHGIPGTGKTSVARALANHFDLPIYYLPLGDLTQDADLMSLTNYIKPKSILLLEDVDVFHAATKRDDEEAGPTVAGMLNALDGIWTPHGLITIMTTNNREALDDALIRAGRVDVDEEFTALDHGQAARLAEYIAQKPCTDRFAEQFVGESPADLIRALREAQTKEQVCQSQSRMLVSGASSSRGSSSAFSRNGSKDSIERLT